jgi:threonine 3-dehydrogenase
VLIPETGPNDVLIRVKATAICGTDLHILPWTEWAAARIPIPMVFGHEFAGEIVEVGSEVSEYKPGDRIAGETHIPCNNCYQCKTNNRHICENMKIIGVHVPGSFCEYISIPKDCVYKISDKTSYEIGAMLEPMGVGVHGVSVAGVKDKTVLVYGCGPIGLMAIGAAKVWGAGKIIAIDLFDEKLNLAKTMGADVTFNAKNTDAVKAVIEATDGIGADIVIDYTGSGKAILDGFTSLRKGGRMVLVGLPSKDLSINLSDAIIYKEATVIGVTGRLMYETWEECEQILATPGFSLDPVIGGIYPLKDYEKAFEALEQGKPGKMILIP